MHKSKKNYLGLFLLMFALSSAVIDVRGEEKVIIQYKQNEKIDLGDLEIKGNVIAPGDISISQRERKRFERPLYDRDNFRYEVRQDIMSIR